MTSSDVKLEHKTKIVFVGKKKTLNKHQEASIYSKHSLNEQKACL